MKKVAIVTGGNSGMGAATVEELSRRGWQVAAMARSKVQKDALVNSAGTTKFVAHADLEGLSAEDFEAIFRVNLIGPFQMIRACLPALKASKGCIVNVSSVASILGTGSSIAYAASKAALDTMSHSLARALGPGIRVNVVAPGYVRTPWQVAAHGAAGAADLERRYAERAPLKDGGMHIASPR